MNLRPPACLALSLQPPVKATRLSFLHEVDGSVLCSQLWGFGVEERLKHLLCGVHREQQLGGVGGLTVNRKVVSSTPLRISRFDEDKCSSSRNYLSGQVCDGGVSWGCWRQYVDKGAGSNPACDHVTEVHPSGGREQGKPFFFFNYTVLKMP